MNAPQPTGGGHPVGEHLRAAYRGLRTGLAMRSGLFLILGLVALAVGIGLAQHGIVDHTFPPFIQGGGDVVITAYSGPWLTAAVVVGAVAGLLLVAAITDFWRRRLIGAELTDSHTRLGQ